MSIHETDPDALTRRNLRHALLRRRNDRVAEGGPAYDHLPVELFLHPLTLEELHKDGDPAEREVMDFLGETFMGIEIVQDGRLAKGAFVVRWPLDLPSAAAAAPELDLGVEQAL